MKVFSIKSTLDAIGLPWATVLLVAIMSTLIYAGPALWQTWTHDGPTLVTAASGDAGGFVAGHDFVAFYSASQAIFDGNAALVYDESYMKPAQHALVGDPAVGYLAFMYPPTYLLLVSPVSLLPYFPALAVWLIAPLLALLVIMGRGVAIPPATLLLALAAPAVAQAAFAGQNGLLFAALLAGGLLSHERRPLLAGILLGLATAKPQLALLIFPALAFGRHWKALFAAAAALAAMMALSAALFGPDIWSAYAAMPGQAREWLATGRLPWPRMPTVYTAVRLAGTGDVAANLVQGAVGLATLAAVAWTWWRGVSPELRVAVLLAGAPLTTPFMYDYDLPLMLPALALFVAHASRTGWRPWEKPLLLVVWLQPAWWWTWSAATWQISIAPVVYGLFLLAVIRRAIPAGLGGKQDIEEMGAAGSP